MDEQDVKSVLEGLLFAAGEEGLSIKELTKIVEMETVDIEKCLHELRVDWREQKRGIQLVKVAKVYQMTTMPEHQQYLQQLAQTPRHSQLSRSSLETLAIVAYQQPITRLDIEEIRGVKSDRIISNLQRKGLIRATGRAEGVGRPILYGTSQEFLDYFGLNQIDELPAPHTIFNWQEWEKDKQDLFKRLGLDEKKAQTTQLEENEEKQSSDV